MIKTRLLFAALPLIVSSQWVLAATFEFEYVGMALTTPDSFNPGTQPLGGHNEFTVLLNGNAGGTYSFANGRLLSYSFEHVTAANQVISTLATTTYRPNSYVTLDANAKPISWFWAVDSSNATGSLFGYSCGYTALCGTDTFVQDHFSRYALPWPGSFMNNEYGRDFRTSAQNDQFTAVPTSPVPELSTFAMMALGVAGLAGARRKLQA